MWERRDRNEVVYICVYFEQDCEGAKSVIQELTWAGFLNFSELWFPMNAKVTEGNCKSWRGDSKVSWVSLSSSI